MDKSFISRKWVQMEVCLRFKNFNQIVVCILIFTEPRPVQTFSDWSSEMKSYTASSLKRLKINLASTTSPFSINYKIRQFRNLSRDLINNINELQEFYLGTLQGNFIQVKLLRSIAINAVMTSLLNRIENGQLYDQL